MIMRSALVAIGAALTIGTTSAAAQRSVPTRDSLIAADYDWQLLSLRGERTSLNAFRGQVLIVNSWATWCEPCVAEIRTLLALRAAVPDSGLAFALIAPQRREPVAEFVRRRAMTLPVFLERNAAPAVFRFEGVPTTLIIDRTGRIVLRHRGAAAWDAPKIRALVESLLAPAVAIPPR